MIFFHGYTMNIEDQNNLKAHSNDTIIESEDFGFIMNLDDEGFNYSDTQSSWMCILINSFISPDMDSDTVERIKCLYKLCKDLYRTVDSISHPKWVIEKKSIISENSTNDLAADDILDDIHDNTPESSVFSELEIIN